MRKEIFTTIAERLLTVSGITYVDLWNDNGAHFAGGAVYPLPSVFIEKVNATNNPKNPKTPTKSLT